MLLKEMMYGLPIGPKATRLPFLDGTESDEGLNCPDSHDGLLLYFVQISLALFLVEVEDLEEEGGLHWLRSLRCFSMGLYNRLLRPKEKTCATAFLPLAMV